MVKVKVKEKALETSWWSLASWCVDPELHHENIKGNKNQTKNMSSSEGDLGITIKDYQLFPFTIDQKCQ